MAQGASRWTVTKKTQLQSQAILWGIFC